MPSHQSMGKKPRKAGNLVVRRLGGHALQDFPRDPGSLW